MVIKKNIIKLLFLNWLLLASQLYTANYTPLFEIQSNCDLYSPENISELQEIVKKANIYNKKICILGAGKSQGGQTLSDLSTYQVNLEKLDNLVCLNLKDKEVTVQAGMSWKKLQEIIAPFGLSVKAMQSFNDFSIGGSLSVNVHGQDLQYNPLIKTVKSFRLILSDGNMVIVSRTERPELFNLVIGGYGLFGIIAEVTLSLTDDILMQRVTNTMKTDLFVNYFLNNIENNPAIIFYSARFSIGPSDLLEKAIVITYEKINQNLEDKKLFDFNPDSYSSKMLDLVSRNIGLLLKNSDKFKDSRFKLEKYFFEKNKIISRNNFMGFSINGLPSNDDKSNYILQEYFIPYAYAKDFIDFLKLIIKSYNINILNITARHVNQDCESILSYSSQTYCAFVLYINLPKSQNNYESTVEWTKRLIDMAISLKGSYYLPYHLIATREQIYKTYSKLGDFITLKKQYDPKEIFTNKLYEKYK